MPEEERDTLSRMWSLLVLVQLMMEGTTEEQILQLAMGAARSFAPCTSAYALLDDGSTFPHRGGMAGREDQSAAWEYPLHSGLGSLVVSCSRQPTDEEQFLLRALAQHCGAAVANRHLHEQERLAAAEAARANTQLQDTLAALQRSMEIHARLTEVAASGQGRQGIAEAVHNLTGCSIAVEDQYGNLRAWAGPNCPEPYAKASTNEREKLVARALAEARPIRSGDRWIGVARPQPDVIGALVLFDPEHRVGEQELTALEHGTTILAMELASLRSLAESELRVRRELMEDLLAGTEPESALRRAQALRYDLERPHRVVIVDVKKSEAGDQLLHAVRRAARDEPVGTLLIKRANQVVVLADHETDWERFRQSILVKLAGGACRLGVGNTVDTVPEIPQSFHQAEIALKVQKAAAWEDQATQYETLGVYQLLAEVENPVATENYSRRWLNPLLEYDEKRHSDLVVTLSRYLELGGSYEGTSRALFVHRSTLKYRLHRIREISGYDLNDPDTRFNLHLACRAWTTLTALRASSGERVAETS